MFFVKNDISDSCIFWLPIYSILGWHEIELFSTKSFWKTTLFLFSMFFVKNDISDSCIFWLPIYNILGWHEIELFSTKLFWKTTLFHAKSNKRS